MVMEVEGPDGSVVEFPDGTPHEVIKGAMAKHFGPPTNNEQPKEPTTLKNLAYGVEKGILEGSSKTAKEHGYTGLASGLTKAAKYVHDAAGLEGYDPTNGDTSLLGQIKNIPNALVQGAPGMAQDIAAGAAGSAIAGPVGGLLGFGGSYYLRNMGDGAERIRKADNKSPDAPLDTNEQSRLGVTLAADALLNRFGVGKTLSPAPVKEVGFKAAPEILKRTGQAIGADAGVSAAGNAIDRVELDNQLPGAQETAAAALTGGAAGAAGSLPNVAKETMRAARFRSLGNIDAGSRERVATLLKDKEGDWDRTKKDLEIDLNFSQKGVASDVKKTLAKARADLKAGNVLDDNTVSTISGSSSPQAAQALQDLNTLNKFKKLDNGGLTNTKAIQAIKPFGHWPTTGLDLGATAVILNGLNGGHVPYFGHMEPSVAAALLGTQAGVYGGARAIDRLSGASNVSKVITDKFAGSPAATSGRIVTPPIPNEQNVPRDMGQSLFTDKPESSVVGSVSPMEQAIQDGNYNISTKHGDIVKNEADDLYSRAGRIAGTTKRVNSRDAVMAKATELNISDEAKDIIAANKDSWNQEFLQNKTTREEAKDFFNNEVLSKFKPEDRTVIRDHFENSVVPLENGDKGIKFFQTWKHIDTAGLKKHKDRTNKK